jgi:hypothetical protein
VFDTCARCKEGFRDRIGNFKITSQLVCNLQTEYGAGKRLSAFHTWSISSVLSEGQRFHNSLIEFCVKQGFRTSSCRPALILFLYVISKFAVRSLTMFIAM